MHNAYYLQGVQKIYLKNTAKLWSISINSDLRFKDKIKTYVVGSHIFLSCVSEELQWSPQRPARHKHVGRGLCRLLGLINFSEIMVEGAPDVHPAVSDRASWNYKARNFDDVPQCRGPHSRFEWKIMGSIAAMVYFTIWWFLIWLEGLILW